MRCCAAAEKPHGDKNIEDLSWTHGKAGKYIEYAQCLRDEFAGVIHLAYCKYCDGFLLFLQSKFCE